MQAVTKLSKSEFDLYMKYRGKTVCWKPFFSYKSFWGAVTGVETVNGRTYLLVYDGIATEGVLESEIQYAN